MKTEAARTVYTGNYVCNAEGLRNFIPFADLKLRMAGPTLGRILTAKIGNRFASANLPILHRRTIPNTHTDEFRSGISIGQYSIDLSGEFRRQFWGDVMLFSIEAIAESECPCTEMSSQSIRDTVQEIQGSIWKLYREKQAASGGKIRKIRDYLSDPHCWWNTEGTMQDSIERFGLFCDSAEQNFGLDSQIMKELAHQIKEGANTRSIIEAIHSLHRDKLLWEELLEMDLTVPDPDQ